MGSGVVWRGFWDWQVRADGNDQQNVSRRGGTVWTPPPDTHTHTAFSRSGEMATPRSDGLRDASPGWGKSGEEQA